MAAKGKITESNDSKRNDILLWLGAFLLITATFLVVNFYFENFSVLGKFLLYFSATLASLFAAYNTTQGRNLTDLWFESVAEIKKVIWPTKKETMQTTGVVLLMIFVMGLILWLLDSILIKIVAFLTNIH